MHGALDGVFPDPRISELLRVAGAPEDIYRRYRAGFFGFRTALDRCRFYTVTPSERLRQKKIQRTAARLVALLDGHRANLRTSGAVVEVIPIGGELIRLDAA